MKRTQLYLPEDLYLRLVQEARRQRRAMAALARDFLQAGVERERKRGKKGGAAVLLRMAEEGRRLGVRAPKDLAVNHDRYLYGDRSPEFGYLYRRQKRKK